MILIRVAYQTSLVGLACYYCHFILLRNRKFNMKAKEETADCIILTFKMFVEPKIFNK